MNIYAMDNDYYVLKTIENQLKTEDVYLCTNSLDMLHAFVNKIPDVVLVEYEAYGSATLIQKIRMDYPDIKIILLVKDRNTSLEIFNMKMDGVLYKPLEAKQLKYEIDRIKSPLLSIIPKRR